MKKLILFSLVVLISGCGIFRQIHKEKETLKTELSQDIKKDSSGVTVDKSVITVKEKVDTILTIPEKKIKQQTILNMDSLINGMTAVKNDLVNVSLILNPVTHILSAVATLKAQVIPFKIDKQTIIQNNIVQASNKLEHIKIDERSDNSHVIVDKKPFKVGIWLIVIFICIFALSLTYWVIKRD